ncbi:hypothetical protein D3C80_1418350 [compost metagenome]
MPQVPVDCVLHAGAIGTGLGAENPPAGLPRSLLLAHALTLEFGTLAAHPGGERVEVIRFVQRGHRLHRRIEQLDEVAEGIAEEPRHPQGHIHPWPVQQAQRQDLEVVDPLAAAGPYRAHAEQGHGLGDIVAAGTHGRRAPHRQAELAQVIAVVLQVALEDQVGRGKTDTPRRGGRQVTHIDGIEVAPGRQHIKAPATGGATGAGRNETALQGGQQPLQFSRATGIQLRRDGLLQRLEYGTHV